MLEMKKGADFDFATLVLNTTYRCNSNCKFCFNRALLNRAPEYSLKEVINRYQFAYKKWNISQVILSGGEPTLHPEFWEIMDFLLSQEPTRVQVSLNTNSLRFVKKDFTSKLNQLFNKYPRKRKKLALSLSDVDHWPAKTKIEKLKIAGIQNAINFSQKNQIKLVVIIAITKDNLKILPKLVKFVTKKINYGAAIVVRGLYLGTSMNEGQKQKVVPLGQPEVIETVKKSLKIILANSKIKITLFNLPFCYFKDWQDLPQVIHQTSPWPHELRISMRKGKRYRQRLFQEEVWSKKTCANCALNPVCNKIQNEYLENYDYPPLSPF